MKKEIKILMVLLCVSLFAIAQDNKTNNLGGKDIRIGQIVPDIKIDGLHNYKDANGKLSSTAKISDFRGKMLILDFWATWCTPCIAMIPKMDSLQKSFGEKIQFLSITYQTEKEVLPFLAKLEKRRGKSYDLPVVTNSKELHTLFPHTSLPHYVWIDGNGVVKAITRAAEVNFENISLILKQERLSLIEKRDVVPIKYNKDVPLLVDGNGGKRADLLYHSIFTKYSGGLKAGHSVQFSETTGWRITALDVSLLHLFKLAFGMNRNYLNNNTISLNVSQPNELTSTIGLRGNEYLNWKTNHAFSYELIVPPSISGENAFNFMQEDLKRVFGQYSAKEEIQTKDCLVIEKIDDQKKYLSKGGPVQVIFNQDGMELQNTYLSIFLAKLNSSYQQKAKSPLIDDTGITEKVDIKLNANLSDISSINLGLQKYGLRITEKKKDIKILVISDKIKD